MFGLRAISPHVDPDVAYGLMVKGMAKKARHARAEALEKVALGFAHHRKPSQLRRPAAAVAIARALVNQRRGCCCSMSRWAPGFETTRADAGGAEKLQQSLGITFIFVTHDQSEALSMSDRVAVFNNGRIEQVDARRISSAPQTAFVAGFVGTANVLQPRRPDDCGMAGSWSLRPEHVRLQGGGEVQVQVWCRRCSIRGGDADRAPPRGWRQTAGQPANIDGAAAASVPRTGEIVQASWSRSAMTPLESGG